MIVTRVPSSAKIEANSQPITPPPTIAFILAGSRSSSSSSSLVVTRGSSTSNTGSMVGREPVARMTASPVRSRDPAVAPAALDSAAAPVALELGDRTGGPRLGGRAGRPGRARPGGRHAHRVAVDQAPVAGDDLDLAALEQVFHAAALLPDHGDLARHEGAEFDPRLAQQDAEPGGAGAPGVAARPRRPGPWSERSPGSGRCRRSRATRRAPRSRRAAPRAGPRRSRPARRTADHDPLRHRVSHSTGSRYAT